MIPKARIFKSEIIEGIYEIENFAHEDVRGLLWTSFQDEILKSILPKGLKFIHDKFAISKKNVLRGFHYDYKSWKLVSCLNGNVLQVVLDMRPGSASYLKHEKFKLDELSKLTILIPPGVGNAFLTNSNFSLYHYKLAYSGEYYDSDKQFTALWNDPKFKIQWPIQNPVLSERDSNV